MSPWRPARDHYPAKLCTPREHGVPVRIGGDGRCQASRPGPVTPRPGWPGGPRRRGRRDPAHAGRGPAGHRDRAARSGQDRGEPGRGARGRRAALAHHQTIRAATGWSYDLRDALGEERYLALRHQGGGYALADIVQFAADGADELPPPGGVAAASGGAAPGGAAAAAGGAAAAADAGTAGLTSREWEIAGLVAEGLSNREIAGRLVISKRTVDAHIEHIYGKIGVSSRVQLASWLRTRPPPNE
jgi:DNA-binding CsgD family transcriptional regulator